MNTVVKSSHLRWRAAFVAMVALACASAAQARFSDNDDACSYSDTSVAVATGAQGQPIETYRGKAVCRRARSGLQDGLFPSSGYTLDYVGTYNRVTRETTETIRRDTLEFAASGRCAINPWINPESSGPNGFRLVPACDHVNFKSKYPYGPADRFPFMARYGGVPYGVRKAQLDKIDADEQALRSGARSNTAPQAPQSVQAFVYAMQGGKTGSVLWLLPPVRAGMWVERFEVELAFVPQRKGSDLGAPNWLADGTAPGRTQPVTSTTDPQQYYTTKKKDFYEDTDYTFRVCAVNNVGRNCSNPVLARWEQPKNETIAIKGRSGQPQSQASAQQATLSGSGTTLQPAPNWGGIAAAPATASAFKSGGGGVPNWGGLPPAPAKTLSGPPPGAAPPAAISDAERAARRQRVGDGGAPSTSAAGTASSMSLVAPGAAVAVQKVSPKPAAAAPESPPAAVVAATPQPAVMPVHGIARKPQAPLRVTAAPVHRDAQHASVNWVAPEQQGGQRIDAFHVLLCPKEGGGSICGGEVVAPIVAPASAFAPGSMHGATVPATATWKGAISPVVKVQVCSANGAGFTCAAPVDVSFWSAPAAGGVMQIQR